MLDDQQFQLKADECLRVLYKALAAASDEHDFETDFGGTLTIEFDDPPAKFVVSPNSPVKQIWVSALAKSFKLGWDDSRRDFVLPETGQTLKEVIEDAMSRHLGEEIRLSTNGTVEIAFPQMSGVYISYPFCAQKCSFCNFASGVYPEALQAEYDAALLDEIHRHAWEWVPDTLYIGGGTPSRMNAGTLASIVAAVPGRPWLEATIEAAPGSLTLQNVSAWRDAGLDRVSLGVQSFVQRELSRTGRTHNAGIVASDCSLLRDHGIGNINIDLIAGLPFQTKESWLESLSWVERLQPPHVSVYLFEVDEDSRLGLEILNNGARYGASEVPSGDAAAELYEIAVERLSAMGIERYEISNFARPGMESHHNLKYWQLAPYVGFGADAHGFDGQRRYANVESAAEYVERWRAGAAVRTSETEAGLGEERLFLGLRLMRGVSPTCDEWGRFREQFERSIEAGLLVRDGENLRLTDRGVLLSNEVFQEFITA